MLQWDPNPLYLAELRGWTLLWWLILQQIILHIVTALLSIVKDQSIIMVLSSLIFLDHV